MTQELTKEQNQAMLKWLNKNLQMLLDNYSASYIAYNENGVISSGKDLDKVMKIAEKSGEHYAIYPVPKSRSSIEFFPIRFRGVSRHQWLPNCHVKLKHSQNEMKVAMLVDSGAEVSLISLNIGQKLGFSLAEAESTLVADTMGGAVEYVVRNVEMTIEEHTFIAPVAWLQIDTPENQLLLGREVVFDKFNIEFRQADEQLILTWRDDNN